jgi:CRP-like cAMP-binding protein
MALPKVGIGVNALVAALPTEESALLAPHLIAVDLSFKQLLQELDEPIAYMWFLKSGVASIVSEMADGTAVEAATVGREGFVGVPLLLATRQSSQRTFMQIPGSGDKLSAGAFDELRPQLPQFERFLQRYTVSLISQIAQGSACNRLHPIEARCARWLLQCHDRMDGDSFPLTHEFLGQMLGVTRPSVTIAARMLQTAGIIRYKRGVIEVLDRTALEQASCECYGVISEEYRRLLASEESAPTGFVVRRGYSVG